MPTLAYALPVTLALALMTGCGTKTIGMAGNDRNMLGMSAEQLERELAAGVCGVWKPTSYSSSKDSPETVDGNRANNRARAAYCAETGR